MSLSACDDNLLGLIVQNLGCIDYQSFMMTCKSYYALLKHNRSNYCNFGKKYKIAQFTDPKHSICKKDFLSKNTEITPNLRKLLDPIPMSASEIEATDMWKYISLNYFCRRKCLNLYELFDRKVYEHLLLNSLIEKHILHASCLDDLIHFYFDNYSSWNAQFVNNLCAHSDNPTIINNIIAHYKNDACVISSAHKYLTSVLLRDNVDFIFSSGKIHIYLDIPGCAEIYIRHHETYSIFVNALHTINEKNLTDFFSVLTDTTGGKRISFTTKITKYICKLPYQKFVEMIEFKQYVNNVTAIRWLYALRKVTDEEKKVTYLAKTVFGSSAFIFTKKQRAVAFRKFTKVLKYIKDGHFAEVKDLFLSNIGSKKNCEYIVYSWQARDIIKIAKLMYGCSKEFTQSYLFNVIITSCNMYCLFAYAIMRKLKYKKNRYLYDLMTEEQLFEIQIAIKRT